MIVNDCRVEPYADLQGANLFMANLFRADLEGANLFRADLQGANLEGANLEGANLQGANLQGANLFMANLFRADLEGANLFRADLQGANLEGANLEGANLQGANLEGVNLVRTKGYIVGPRRSDGYRFDIRLFEGSWVVVAGCRTINNWTTTQYRHHVKTYTCQNKKLETLAILDYLDSMVKVKELQK